MDFGMRFPFERGSQIEHCSLGKRCAFLFFDKATESAIGWMDHGQFECGSVNCGLLKYGDQRDGGLVRSPTADEIKT